MELRKFHLFIYPPIHATMMEGRGFGEKMKGDDNATAWKKFYLPDKTDGVLNVL